ncbi:putative LMBR1-like membrane protein [Trypanosoma theileri]|uniref:Putative LMBR1-like membrane protein n=1 Tax=Trypanosoma theileri TaxID=67003 RepID=A0A1X0P250_9TRYP|nr:putative LMBR1-like membrane protein [Trypanosoma theileri]ORC91026.1 putative LMBR1-like membrane protein [Trypanosoma theileri]
MPAANIVSTIIFFCLTVLATLLIFRHYTRVSAKSMPLFCRVFIIIAFCSFILPFPLLVVDINAALYAKANPSTPQDTWLIGVWYAIVGATYIMGWGVLPISQSYTEVGNFTPKRKIISIVKSNLKMYAISIILLVVFFAYIAFLKGAYDSFTNIWKLAISLANAWGLMLLVLFMSAGLVGVPMMLWRNSDAVRMLRRQYFSIVDIQEDLDIAAMDLADVKAELMMIHPLVAEEHKIYWSEMIEAIATADREIPQYHSASARLKPTSQTNHTDVSLPHLEELNARVKYSIKIAQRMNYLWESTIRKCQSYDELIHGSSSTNNQIKKIWFSIRSVVFKGFAVCTSILTILVLWSELVLPFQPLTSKRLSVIALVVESNFELSGSMIFMFYMAYCSYWAILQFKVFDMYVILPGISDNASLCFSATFLSRLIMPLCFNYLLIAGLATEDIDVMYGHVYRRNMDVSLVLGSWLNQFIPMFIPFVSVLVLSRVVDRLFFLIGVEVHNPDDAMNEAVRQRIEDGYRIVTHALGHPLTALETDGIGFAAGDAAAAAGGRGNAAQNQARQQQERGERYKEYLAKRKAAGEKEPV